MNETTAETSAALVSKLATAAQYGGSGTAMYFGLTANELAAFGGLAVAIVGFVVNAVVNFYFKSQHLKLARKNATEFYDE